ncbi:MAG: Hsp20/alpha crystallin family protein [Candidatus Zixiibacteriota bacterium]
MQIVKEHTLGDLYKMEREMERILRDFFVSKNPLLMVTENTWSPHIDVFETKTEFVVRMDIAGIEKEDIQVRLSGNTLTIRGRRSDTWNAERIHYYQMEISYGNFERIIELPESFDGEQIKATYDKGFLEITLPKLVSVSSEPISIKIED